MNIRLAAGRGPWASPRRWAILVGALAVAVVVLTAFALTRGPSPATGGRNATASAPGPAASEGPGGQVIGAVPGFPSSIGGIHLVAAQYAATDLLGKPGGGVMATLISSLGKNPANVKLTAGVDTDERLSVGVWAIPGAGASALLDAWKTAAAGQWQTQTIAGLPTLVGTDATTSRPAYVASSDGRLVYIVTSDRTIAEAALTALR